MLRYFLTLTLFSIFLYAQAPFLLLENENNHYNNFTVSYLNDSSDSLEIKDIVSLSQNFKPSSNSFSFGYMHNTLWIKINLQNLSSKKEFILSLNEHFYEKANLYYFNNSWIKVENGVFIPLHERVIQTPKLNFPFTSSNKEETIFLELKGKYSYFGNITISTVDSFYSQQFLTIESFFIFIFGVLSIIILFIVFLWINLKEKIYLYYAGYTFFLLIYIITISGVLAYVELQYYMYKLHASVSFATAFLVLFSMEYFNAKKELHYINYILNICLFCLIFFGIMLLFTYTPWNKLLNYTVTISIMTLIITAIIMISKGRYYVKYYLFAILLYFSSVILFTLLLIGVLEYNFLTRYSYIFALCIEVAIFSLMLANHYNIIKNEKIQTQKKLLNLQNNQNIILEKEVNKQTKNLKDANKILSTLVKERELLLKEVFHRVKNNFHMISAFLWFESQKEKDKNRFSELLNRIKSMSVIHEYLYNSKDLVNIDINEYLNEIINTIVQTYHNKNVTLNTKVDKIHIDINHIMYLGVILNEIISNSIKHHNKKRPIILDITCLKKEHLVILHVKDNGVGFDINETFDGFGLKLIKDFTKKLPQGEFCFLQNDGTIFELTFKDINNE